METASQTAGADPMLGGSTFAELVTRYHALVCAVAYGATGDTALSEDVAQDTFVVAWRGRHTLRDPSRTRAWLCAIARHLALNTRRSRRHDPLEDDAAIAADVDLHTRLEHAQQGELVWQAIAAIPERYRVVLVLYYREDKSVAEVASALGITEANALQRLSRGRRHLEHGIEALVERTLSGSKQSAARRQAVLAAVAADLTPVSADAALEAARVSIESASWKVTIMKVAIATCALAGAVTVVQWGCAGGFDKEQPAAESREEAAEIEDGERDAIADLRKQAQLAELDRAKGGSKSVRSGTSREAGTMAATLPTYRLSLIDVRRVAVNLDGGPSGLMGANEALGIDLPATPAKPQRKVTGRVVDAAGVPVAGAVVIAGEQLSMMLDTSIAADAGDETDARGRYDVSVTAEDPCTLFALHGGAGWSAPLRIEAGSSDAVVDLVLDAPVRVHGTARRGDASQDGVVIVSDADLGMVLSYPTDDAGRYGIVIPRGPFTIGFRPGERVGVTEPKVRKPIDLRAGAELEWDPDIAIGTRLVVDAPLPPGDPESITMIWVGVVPGHHAPADAAALRALAKQRDDASLRGFGGVDLEEVFEFEDLAAGTYTVCADAESRQGRLAPRTSVAFVCREVVLADGEDVHELKIAW